MTFPSCPALTTIGCRAMIVRRIMAEIGDANAMNSLAKALRRKERRANGPATSFLCALAPLRETV